MRIGGIFQPNALIGKYLVSDAFFLAHFRTPCRSPSCSRPTGARGRAERQACAGRLPEREGPDPGPVREVRSRQQVNQLLGLVYALLALAVIIALIGIVNTLMLSVFERTHEIGLLRAVGMKRRQIRAMIRSESVILAVFGAVIGIIVGTGLGIALGVVAQDRRASPTSWCRSRAWCLPDPGRVARAARRQLAGTARRQARRAGRHRGRLTSAQLFEAPLDGDAPVRQSATSATAWRSSGLRSPRVWSRERA